MGPPRELCSSSKQRRSLESRNRLVMRFRDCSAGWHIGRCQRARAREPSCIASSTEEAYILGPGSLVHKLQRNRHVALQMFFSYAPEPDFGTYRSHLLLGKSCSRPSYDSASACGRPFGKIATPARERRFRSIPRIAPTARSFQRSGAGCTADRIVFATPL